MGSLRPLVRHVVPLRQKHPGSLPLQLLLGHCYASQLHCAEALSEYFYAYRLAPAQPLVLLCLGVTYISQVRWLRGVCMPGH